MSYCKLQVLKSNCSVPLSPMLLFSAEKGEIFVSTINGSNLLAANFVGDFISNMAGPCALKKNKHLRILFRVIHNMSAL